MVRHLSYSISLRRREKLCYFTYSKGENWHEHASNSDPFYCGCVLSEETCEPLGLTHDERAPLLLRVRTSNSSWVSLINAPITSSSRCFTKEVPGIGSIVLERWRSQASAI